MCVFTVFSNFIHSGAVRFGRKFWTCFGKSAKLGQLFNFKFFVSNVYFVDFSHVLSRFLHLSKFLVKFLDVATPPLCPLLNGGCSFYYFWKTKILLLIQWNGVKNYEMFKISVWIKNADLSTCTEVKTEEISSAATECPYKNLMILNMSLRLASNDKKGQSCLHNYRSLAM